MCLRNDMKQAPCFFVSEAAGKDNGNEMQGGCLVKVFWDVDLQIATYIHVFSWNTTFQFLWNLSL